MPLIVRSASAALPDGIPDKEGVVVGNLVMVEVPPGFRDNRQFCIAQIVLETPIFQPPVGCADALERTRSHRTLRTAGVSVRKVTGRLIPTFCVESRNMMFHANRDLLPSHPLMRAVPQCGSSFGVSVMIVVSPGRRHSGDGMTHGSLDHRRQGMSSGVRFPHLRSTRR